MTNIFPLKFYIISSFINFATPFILGFLLLKNYRAKPNRLFSIFSFTVAYWAWFYSMWLLTEDNARAEFYLRTCMIGVLFMPSLFIHFVTTFLNKPKGKMFYRFNYVLSLLFTLTVYTPLYAHTPTPHLVFYWLHPGPVFHLALSHFSIIVGYSFWLMFKELRKAKGVFRNQLMYVFVGTAIGYSGGSTNYFCWYRIPIPPFLNACVAVYVGFVTYAIVRYKLLDIHFVIRKVLTNFIVSSIISIGMICIAVFPPSLLSKAIIFIILGILLSLYLPTFKIRTENKINHILYKGKYDYLVRIEQFVDKKMARIPKEEDLIKDTAILLIRDMYAERVILLIRDNITGDYLVRYKINIDVTGDIKLPQTSRIVNWLEKEKKVFVLEEEEKILHTNEGEAIRKELEPFQSTVCVPARLDSDMVCIIALGNKTTGEMYTHVDLELLERLGIHLAMALDYKRIEAQLRKEQELASIGIMSMEISHELRNLLQLPQTYIDLSPEKRSDDEFFTSFRNMAMDRMKVTRDKLNDIMYLGKERPLSLAPDIELNILLDENLTANDFSIKKENIEVIKEYSNIPPIEADKSQLTHLFNNLILNAIDAMKNRGGKFRIRTMINTKNITQEMKNKANEWIRIEIKDDGSGIPDNVFKKLFTPFVTTKSMGHIEKSGTGLGLSVVKKVVDAHKGYIHVHTKEGKGTTFVVDLPAVLKSSSAGPTPEPMKGEPWEYKE